ncbi:MAG: hypothetical protein J6K52_05235 [Clostridia bacterium]|nr:hypothetical protein [Clostridia bacterium]
MFKTELHCHSNSVSECARVSNNDIIEKFTGAGYTTLVLANHFNKGTMRYLKCETYDEFVTKYIDGYNSLKNDAKGILNVLLGLELRFSQNINDYLLFGATEAFLRSVPDIFDMGVESFHKIASENGCLLIQAHPFRNGMTVTRPDMIDGVEVFNGHFGHDSRNDIANMWADKFSLIKTSGTDFHYKEVPANAGIYTENEITSMDMLVDILKNGKYTLVNEVNK